MIGRPSLSGRVGLIIVVALLAAWLTFIAAMFLARGPAASAVLPSPLRLAALTELVERAGPAQRDRLMASARTPEFAVWTAPAPPAPPTLSPTPSPTLSPTPSSVRLAPGGELVSAERMNAYREALAPRPLTVLAEARLGPFGLGLVSALRSVEFHIGLAGGETLIVRTEGPVLVAPIGLPIGLGAGL
ncbi:MAG: hypothetical protein AAF192_11270, partial [Pseudomonadota bacterium]